MAISPLAGKPAPIGMLVDLAKLEGEIAIGELVRRFDGLRLVSENVEWGPSLFRVPGRLPITFKAR